MEYLQEVKLRKIKMKNKKAHGMVDIVIKWFLYISLVVVAGGGVWFIVKKFA